MKIIEMAGIKIGFRADFEIFCDKQMEMFLNESKIEKCDFIFDVECDHFPQIPDSKPVYQSAKECVYEDDNVRLSYYRHRAHVWEFCVVKEENRMRILVLPEYKKYAENMWNLVNKIELSSLLLKKRALILHASFIIHKERAVLFTGPSGIGKSTQAELWERIAGSETVNGDRVIIKEKKKSLYAFGLPFSGSSGICVDKEAPICGIVILDQGKKNCVCKLSAVEAVKFLYSQAAVIRWKEGDVLEAIQLLEEFITRVPVLKLTCLPEKEAVYVLDDYLKKEEGK